MYRAKELTKKFLFLRFTKKSLSIIYYYLIINI